MDKRPRISKGRLEALYRQYNQRGFVQPDPIQFLYQYEDPGDREVAALVASSLAYGRVAQILKSVSLVLERMTPTPFVFLKHTSPERILKTFAGFKHRFTTAEKLCTMLVAIKEILERHGSLHVCFSAGLRDDDQTILPALCAFARELSGKANGRLDHLVPSPVRGSACKRFNLFLRWMVRRDDVDPGGWENVPASKLIVPVDTHMHRICLYLGLTTRKQANMTTALEITEGFRALTPEDPVKYDFSLTRLGIRQDTNLAAFLKWGMIEQRRPY
jgi:uncharacterized protein (TIGR02757 family)